MRRLSLNFFVFAVAALTGVSAAWIFDSIQAEHRLFEPKEIIVAVNDPLAIVNVEPTMEQETVSTNPLDSIWVENDELQYLGYKISKTCQDSINLDPACSLTITKGSKVFDRNEAWKPEWLDFGLFDFLGRGDKQLVVHTYSGGAHCCNDYIIYDLSPKFRIIYDSSRYDSANEIGRRLTPVDFNSDGIFEFQQSNIAFAYFHASYADSNKPPVIFSYDAIKGRYEIANKKFPAYVLADTQRGLDWFAKNKATLDDYDRRYILRMTFLNQIYAGHNHEAWKYFNQNYHFEDKEEYRKDVKTLFATDPVYLSIYRR